MGKYERNMKSLTAGIPLILILAIGMLVMLMEAIGNILKLLLEYWYVVLLVTAIGFAPHIFRKIKEAKESKLINAKKDRISSLLSSLIEIMDDNSVCWNEIGTLAKEVIGKDIGVKNMLEDGYAKIISKSLEDGNVSDEERNIISIAEANLGLDQDAISEIKKSEYLKYFRKAIEDNVLTQEEEQNLLVLRLSLS